MNAFKLCLAQLSVAIIASIAFPANAFVALVARATVSDTVTGGPALTAYQYSVTNTSSLFGGGTIDGLPVATLLGITDFYLPYFDDSGTSAITSPSNWSWAIQQFDLFELGFTAGVLHWHTDTAAIAVGAMLAGFGFNAPFSPVKAPFQIYIQGGGNFQGDPPIPGSPNAMYAGLPPIPTAIPEPSSLALLAGGFLVLLLSARRRPA